MIIVESIALPFAPETEVWLPKVFQTLEVIPLPAQPSNILTAAQIAEMSKGVIPVEPHLFYAYEEGTMKVKYKLFLLNGNKPLDEKLSAVKFFTSFVDQSPDGRILAAFYFIKRLNKQE